MGITEKQVKEDLLTELSRNITVSKSLEFYKRNVDSNGSISSFQTPEYPFIAANWEFDLRINEEHKFDSFLNKSIHLYKWYWPMCGQKLDGQTVIKPLKKNGSISIFTVLSQKGLIGYSEGVREKYERDKYYFLSGDILLSKNPKVYKPQYLEKDKTFMKCLVEINYWNYSPQDIVLKSVRKESFVFCFISKLTGNNYQGKVVYTQGRLVSSELKKIE